MSEDLCVRFGLVPRPAEVSPRSGQFNPAGAVLAGSREALEAVRAAWPQCPRQEAGLPELTLRLGAGAGRPQPAGDLVPPAQAEGYALRLAPEGATVVGSDPAGLFYGVETLRQLCSGESAPPCLEIRDWPRHAWRGVQVDLGRQREGLGTLRRYVDLAASCKLRQVYLYLENALAWTACPDAVSPDALTLEEVRELDAYCRERYVELIPAPNFLGHNSWLLSHPGWAHLNETREGPNWRRHMGGGGDLCTSLPETWELLESMIEDLQAAFSSSWVHAGLDETWSLTSCPLCARLREECGPGETFKRHVLRLHELLAGRGRRMMMWADMFAYWPGILEEIPREVMMVDWYYQPVVDHLTVNYLNWTKIDSPRHFREKGFPVLMAPWYREYATWTLARTARLEETQGLLLTAWEQSQEMLHELVPPMVYGADCAWAARLETPQEARPRLAQRLCGTREMAAQVLLDVTSDSVRVPAGEGQGPGRFLRYRREHPDYTLAQRTGLWQEAIAACRAHPAFAPEEPARLLRYLSLRADRWDNAARLNWLVNEAACSARAWVAGKGREEAQADLRRYAAELDETARRQAADLEKLQALWEEDRPGIEPVQSVLARLAAEVEKTGEWARELAAFAEAPEAGKAPFDRLRLVIEAMLPEANAQRLQVEASVDGEAWEEVVTGGFRRLAQDDYYPVCLDHALGGDAPEETRFVRLSSPGVASLGLRTVRLIDTAQERLPRRIVETAGPVWFPEHLLADDSRVCLLNEAEVAKSFHQPESLETARIVLEF